MFRPVIQAFAECAMCFSEAFAYFHRENRQRKLPFVDVCIFASGRTVGAAGCRWFHTTGSPSARQTTLPV